MIGSGMIEIEIKRDEYSEYMQAKARAELMAAMMGTPIPPQDKREAMRDIFEQKKREFFGSGTGTAVMYVPSFDDRPFPIYVSQQEQPIGYVNPITGAEVSKPEKPKREEVKLSDRRIVGSEDE